VLEGDEILVGVGRRPSTGDLGLDTIGLEPGKYVTVDDQLRAPDHEWLFAIGDVNGRVLLTHMGKYQGRVAADVSRRGMRFVSFETETTDSAGEPLCKSRALFVIRS